MKLDNRGLDSRRVWATATDKQVSARCHNILMRGCPELRSLTELFALPLGRTNGVYKHHDGWRCP